MAPLLNIAAPAKSAKDNKKKKKIDKAPLVKAAPATSPAKSSASSAATPSAATSLTTLCGYQLDTPTVPRERKFINSLDIKFRDAKLVLDAAAAIDSIDKLVDGDFTDNIRKLSGCDNNIVSGGYTNTKVVLFLSPNGFKL